MTRTVFSTLLAALMLASGPVSANGDLHRDGGKRPSWGCQPVLPILDVSVNSDGAGSAVPECSLIKNPAEWAAYCVDNGLLCDPFDDDFFDNWTIVAIVVDTWSPVVCENAGLVPGWELGCLTVRARGVRARVSAISAGSWCHCSAGPQWPVRRHMVQAIPAVGAADCGAWKERHVIECLPGR